MKRNTILGWCSEVDALMSQQKLAMEQLEALLFPVIAELSPENKPYRNMHLRPGQWYHNENAFGHPVIQFYIVDSSLSYKVPIQVLDSSDPVDAARNYREFVLENRETMLKQQRIEQLRRELAELTGESHE